VKEKSPRNIAASIHRRLLNLARERGDDFQIVLTHYAIERLLYRLSRSPHADRFLLKGAMLMAVWTSQPYRPTRDLNLSGRGDSSVAGMESIFRDLCQLSVENDGLAFDGASVQGAPIREDQEYEGVRVMLVAALGKARIVLQVDIGFGDSVVPAPQALAYPTLLDLPAPEMKAYPRETVVAEKFQAMVALGAVNSRLKDFYDVWLLARLFKFEGPTLSHAIGSTFARRGTPLPSQTPSALTDEFISDHMKQTQWRAFISRGRFIESPPPFAELVAFLRDFMMPPADAAIRGHGFGMRWYPGGPWR